jgi:hypothetical protein
MAPVSRSVRRRERRWTICSGSTWSRTTALRGAPSASEVGVEPLGLGEGPGEAVEDEPVVVELGEGLRHEPVRHGVRDELAAVHIRAGLDADGGLVLERGAEEVARGDLHQAEPVRQEAAWVPLPAPGGPNNTSRIRKEGE